MGLTAVETPAAGTYSRPPARRRARRRGGLANPEEPKEVEP